jgi:hypothetical protein
MSNYIKPINLMGGQADCSIIDPQKYKFCDNPIEELNQDERIECDRVKGPYRYNINVNDPEMNSSKCKKNTGAITYECAKDRFNSYYDLKNSTDSGKMRGKLFDAKYNKKPSLILYPGEACSSKYLHGEGVKTFDVWGVDAFPEDSCALFNQDKHVTSKCYKEHFKNELKYGPELNRLTLDDNEQNLYNQYFTGNPEHLAKARNKNWENFHKNPKIRKITPKTNDEFLEYMIDRNVSEDRPIRKSRVNQHTRRNAPIEPIFVIDDAKDKLSPKIVDDNTSPKSINSGEIIPISIPELSPMSIPELSPMSIPDVSPALKKEQPLILDEDILDLSGEDILLSEDEESDINKLDEVFDLPEIEDDDSVDFDIIFKQPDEIDYDPNTLEYVKEGIITNFDTFENLIVIDDIIGKKRIYYLYNADNNFIYEIPLNIVALISQFDFENKMQIETFLNIHRKEIFDKLQTPYYPIGSYFGSNEFQFFE